MSITWSSYCFILIIYWSRFWRPVQYFVGAGQLTPCANIVHLMMRMMMIKMARIHPEQWWYYQIMVMAMRIRKMVTLSENETSIASLPPSLWNPGAHSHSSRIWKLIFAQQHLFNVRFYKLYYPQSAMRFKTLAAHFFVC